MALLLVVGIGCGRGGAARVDVHASLSDGEPLPGLSVSVLPFDPNALLDSLAAAATTSRPTFPELERTLGAYRLHGDSVDPAAADAPWRALRDSVSRLADSLGGTDRRAPGYAAAYARFRRMYARLAQRAAELDAQIRATRQDDLTLANRARAAAESLRVWERDAYAAYPTLARAAAARTGRTPREVTTDSAGAARLELESGLWWLVARWPDPENPFEEYRWSLPIRVAAGFPLRAPLVPTTAARHWRH